MGRRFIKRRSPILGTMLNEVEISAIGLRTQLTMFAAACQHDARLDAKQKSYVQRRILKRAERYQVSFQYGRHQRHNSSSLTLAVLQQRLVKYPQDFLAISANCCGYARRLDHEAIARQNGVSLGMSLFVQALPNGEVLDNRTRGCGTGSTIFVQHESAGWVVMSWHKASDLPFRNVGEPMDKHSYLELESKPHNNERNTPTLRMKRWINGLCFPQGVAAQKVVFPWPDWLLQVDATSSAHDAKRENSEP